MKTYEEIIAENPDAGFFVYEEEYYCCKESKYSLVENLMDNHVYYVDELQI